MKSNKAISQIKGGSIISYGTIAFNIALGLLYTPWILQEIGSSSYGLYTLASSLIALFLLDFGMSAAVSRFVSRYRALDDQKAVNAFVGIATKFYLIICTIIAVILIGIFFNIGHIYKNLSVDELSAFKIVFIITGFFVVVCFPVNVCNGILNAYEQYIPLKLADVINKGLTVVVTIIALKLHGGLYALVFINGFCNLLTMLVKLLFIKLRTPVKLNLRNKSDKNTMKEIFQFSLWSTVKTLAQQMVFNLIPTVLAMTTNTFAISMYGFANVIEGYVYNITQAVNGFFMPSVSRIVVKEENASKALPLMTKVGRINLSIISLLLIGLTVLGKEFVTLWLGAEYLQLYYCIIVLVIPYFISSSQQIAETSVTVMNKVQYSALINLIIGVTNLIVAYFVSQKYGVIGVCTVTGAMFILRSVLSNLVYIFVLKINILKFFASCHLKMLPGIIISLILSYLFNMAITKYNILPSGWIFFFAKAGIISVIYFICMWLLGWNKFEKDLILSFTTRFIKKRPQK